ncbi:D-alanyl-D-alanine carboxypeptidase family protein [Alkalihalobacillus macyae]|uniref:D-alanyl-D-alanine carboxypeptidase family protein n=1 Tax=Guptibacillus hwajinpoensis TaxID=208199 RepID=UPI00273C465D|nr:D-alanyl-D-alanine carboxypeptidase family protein [Alkalihalobacillus macyae]MDP4553504.1 D-alanyl-D-alanine carboxypeptidase family protein [Alkalihalobacillus macyae]
MKNLGFKAMIVTMAFVLLLAGTFGGGSAATAAEAPEINAEAAILIDANSGKILYQKDPELTLSPASMTKMMSEYLLLEAISKNEIAWDDKVSISETIHKLSQNRSLSNVPLRVDEKYTVKELYEAMAIYSANAATMALAEHLAGSETKFVEMMNAKAKEMGMTEYKFVNSSGLNNRDLVGNHPAGGPEEENMMSARSTGLLAYNLLKDYPEVLETTSTPVKNFRDGTDDEIIMKNWNWLLPTLIYANKYSVDGIDGLKTGSTDLAGYAFTGTAKQGDMRLISVVMKTDSYEARFNETAKLLNFGFDQFESQSIITKGDKAEGNSSVSVVKGKEKQVGVAAGESFSAITEKNTEQPYELSFEYDQALLTDDGELTAPIKEGDQVGKVVLKSTGEDFGYITGDKGSSVPLVATDSVEKAGWFTLSMRAIGGFFGGIWTSAADAVKGLFS